MPEHFQDFDGWVLLREVLPWLALLLVPSAGLAYLLTEAVLPKKRP